MAVRTTTGATSPSRTSKCQGSKTRNMSALPRRDLAITVRREGSPGRAITHPCTVCRALDCTLAELLERADPADLAALGLP